jgi:prepilin-type N-terminal cleavage/methylation domain-containing protein
MNARPENEKGFSLIELLIVVTIILIIAAIAIPNLMKSKIQANEAAAVETLKTLDTSVVMYSNTYGGFPHALSDMGPAGGAANATSAAADLIDVVLASGVKAGYKFTYTVGTSDPAGNVLTYSVTAIPVIVGTTGQRSFYTDQSGVVRATTSGVADASSTPIG